MLAREPILIEYQYMYMRPSNIAICHTHSTHRTLVHPHARTPIFPLGQHLTCACIEMSDAKCHLSTCAARAAAHMCCAHRSCCCHVMLEGPAAITNSWLVHIERFHLISNQPLYTSCAKWILVCSCHTLYCAALHRGQLIWGFSCSRF